MQRRPPSSPKTRLACRNNRFVSQRQSRRAVGLGKRARGLRKNVQEPFSPPEDWHEPGDDKRPGYRVVVQDPGDGYTHVVTEQDVRARLAALPASMTAGLDVVQLSRITRKKETFPCYGMQWGTALYLYPIESELVEIYAQPPTPEQRREAKMYGGRWRCEDGFWYLQWTAETIRDYYLNNILIHELGHLLDERNGSYTDRERYADWFAIEYGYRATRRRRKQKIRRRHHSQ